MSAEEIKKKRDDFTWFVLQLSMGKRKKVPLKGSSSAYGKRPYSYPSNYRFKDDNEIMAEQERRMRLARLIRIASTIVMIGLVVAIFFMH